MYVCMYVCTYVCINECLNIAQKKVKMLGPTYQANSTPAAWEASQGSCRREILDEVGHTKPRRMKNSQWKRGRGVEWLSTSPHWKAVVRDPLHPICTEQEELQAEEGNSHANTMARDH